MKSKLLILSTLSSLRFFLSSLRFFLSSLCFSLSSSRFFLSFPRRRESSIPSFVFSFFLLIFIFFALPHFASASAVINSSEDASLQQGLVGWWTFDGNNMARNVKDSSGQNNNGYLQGFGATSTAVVKGKIGQGLKFDGISKNVTIANSASLNTLAVNNQITISFWVYRPSGASYNANYFFIAKSSGTTNWRLRTFASTGYIFQHSGVTAASWSTNPMNIWHLITIVGDATGSRIYSNGVVVATDGVAFTGSDVDTSALTIGNGGTTSGVKIDDVRIYNRALSATEIKQLYNLGSARVNQSLPDIERGLVGWWTFDGNDMTQNVKDSSGQNNNGALVGFTSTSTAVVKGKIGQALKFDGVNDYVSVRSTSLQNLPDNALTYSAWVRVNNSGINGYLFSNGSGSANNGWVFYIDQYRRAQFAIQRSVTDMIVLSNVSTLPDYSRGWFHLVITYSGGLLVSNSHIYVNGLEVSGYSPATIDGEGEYQSDSGRESRLGRSNFTGYANLSLDDVRIYNRALSATEIKQLYNLGSARVNQSLPDIESGLVGWWTFDGNNMAQNVKDSSGQNNNGALVGFTSTSTAVVKGKIGQALKFDGVNDYVNKPTRIINALPFTLAGWVRSDGTQRGTILSLESNNSTRDISIGITETGKAYSIFTDGSSFSMLTGTANITNKWTFVVATYDNPNGIHRLYVNGQYDKIAISFVPYSVMINSFSIGRTSTSTPTSYMKGSIDDVRIYNRALSATEIKQLYNLGR